MLKTLDFPIRPCVRKYLDQQLGADPYVLSNTGRFGRFLFQLLRRQLKGRLHHAGSREDCTCVLKMDMRLFPVHQYGLTELTNYTIVQFNDYCEEWMMDDLYNWVRSFVNPRTSVKEVITDFMAGYDLREEDKQYETLRKAVQRNVDVKALRKPLKNSLKSVGKMSQKSGVLSREIDVLSQKDGNLSRYDMLRALRQQLKKEEV